LCERHVWDDVGSPWEPRTCRTCTLCGAVFRDMEHYVVAQTLNMPVYSVIDFGTGLKGPVAQHYWQTFKEIRKGYCCDVWKIKELPDLWIPMNVDAFDLFKILDLESVDVVQAFGFLEHLEKEDGFRFLEMAEELAGKLVIVSAASCIHALNEECGDDPDYKVKRDGNPYHRYNSTWGWVELEEAGFETNWEDWMNGESFKSEVVAWKRLEG